MPLPSIRTPPMYGTIFALPRSVLDEKSKDSELPTAYYEKHRSKTHKFPRRQDTITDYKLLPHKQSKAQLANATETKKTSKTLKSLSIDEAVSTSSLDVEPHFIRRQHKVFSETRFPKERLESIQQSLFIMESLKKPSKRVGAGLGANLAQLNQEFEPQLQDSGEHTNETALTSTIETGRQNEVNWNSIISLPQETQANQPSTYTQEAMMRLLARTVANSTALPAIQALSAHQSPQKKLSQQSLAATNSIRHLGHLTGGTARLKLVASRQPFARRPNYHSEKKVTPQIPIANFIHKEIQFSSSRQPSSRNGNDVRGWDMGFEEDQHQG